MQKKSSRLAIIDPNKCKPTKCNKECKTWCPVERQGKQCVDIEEVGTLVKTKLAKISESNCIGCGICVKKCPYDAITIVNVPSEYGQFITHRYGENGFRLYDLPTLKPGQVHGIIGSNGGGKSSILSIFSGILLPNFEDLKHDPTTKTILTQFKGKETQKYFQKLYRKELTIVTKVQHVESCVLDMSVKEYMLSKIKMLDNDLAKSLDINPLLTKNMKVLSGGELQRVICATSLMSQADVYIFDEPSNFLDVKQRLKLARAIRNIATTDKYVLVVEHDLSMLDFMSDYITIVYGVPTAFGTSSMPHSTAEAINMYFDGYLPVENVKFRTAGYKLNDVGEIYEKPIETTITHSYSETIINYPNYTCKIESGTFPISSSINIILGENGSGKTTFINYISTMINSDKTFTISSKDQTLNISKFRLSDGTYPTVQELFYANIRTASNDSLFVSDVIRPLNIDKIKDRKINELSGGELQRICICLCLGTDAQIYFIDEPSACLDIEQRMIITKIIKKFVMHNNKIAFVVEHDLLMAMILAQESNSQVIVASENEESIIDAKSYTINAPCKSKEGVDKFLKQLDITVRMESSCAKHVRPRINKPNSTKDKEQKAQQKYYA